MLTGGVEIEVELLPQPGKKMHTSETGATALQKAFIVASTVDGPMAADMHRRLFGGTGVGSRLSSAR
jgi:hypothetical protein